MSSTSTLARQSEIRKFKDYAELAQFLEDNQGAAAVSYGRSAMPGMQGMDIAMPEAAIDSQASFGGKAAKQAENIGTGGIEEDAAAAGDYSKTNIQVEGVDEADIVKTDGAFIYAVAKNSLFIVKAVPPGGMEIISMIKFESVPQDIYLKGDRLAVYGNDTSSYRDEAVTRYKRYSPYVFFKVFDISDRKNPRPLRDLDFEGSFVDSRLIGDYAYLVISNYSSYLDDPVPLPRILEKGDSLPLACGEAKCINPDVYYIDIPYSNYHYTSIAAINIADAAEQVSEEVYLLSENQNMYVSQSSAYVTYTKYVSEYELMLDVMRELVFPKLTQKDKERIEKIEQAESAVLTAREKQEKIMAVIERFVSRLPEDEQKKLEDDSLVKLKAKYREISKELEKTVIHKIALAGRQIEYKASGEVTGSVLNQFSMDESGGYFRIATTKGRSWGEFLDENEQESYSNLFVLDKDLKMIGAVEGLARGERIYSARFMGNRAYMVTFKQTDPLFAIDLSDPKDPKVLGQLKIPGFSNYLHPYDDKLLIGIGQDTEENSWGGTATKGLKISLFDVSDIANPREAAKLVLGGAGSNSDALRDHKAVLFSKEKNLLVLPVSLAEGGLRYYQNFQGAAVLSVKPDKIELKGRISHGRKQGAAAASMPEEEIMPRYYGWDSVIRRSLYIGDTLYTVSNKYLKANALSDLKEIEELELEMKKTGADYEIIN